MEVCFMSAPLGESETSHLIGHCMLQGVTSTSI